jgi:cellulose synthase/poly-beta-1,6-N-acetylglucosamine synthase-like glycosyltransferase
MGTSPPDISVVTPLYNKENVLPATLASVLGQSFRQFEFIVVDDGSTDEGGSLVNSLADPRVRLIRQTNQGSSAARNRGILEARGKWVAFIDADDLWAPDHLETLVSAVGEPGLIGAFSNFKHESNGRLAVPAGVPSQRVDDYFSFALAANGYAMSSSSVLLETRRLIDAGLFPVGTPVGEDTDMWCRLAMQGSFLYVANPSATYRDNIESSSLARHLKQEVPYPVCAQRLNALISAGDVPDRLVASARRYANFLLLEYARQLLDRGDYLQAREVLLQDCTFSLDPKRYVKRFARTWPLGLWGYRLYRQIGSSRI